MRSRWPALIVLLGCGRAPQPWTREAALAPTLAALDRDGDGAVGAAEWGRVQYASPVFARVDSDGDGALSSAELMTVLYQQDPLKFDNPATRAAPSSALQSVYFPRPYSVRVLRDGLLFVREELAARDAGLSLPDPALIDAAASTAALSSPESLTARAMLSTACDRAAVPAPPLVSLEKP